MEELREDGTHYTGIKCFTEAEATLYSTTKRQDAEGGNGEVTSQKPCVVDPVSN